VAAIATVRAAYEQALAGALERRGLPATVGAAVRLGVGAESRRRREIMAAVREAQLEAHRLVAE
jgi:UDP-N-acetylenolpyruvoylglucosamine reductase